MAGGRPTTYNQEMLDKCYDYIENCPDVLPSIVGLALHINRAKATIYAWEKEEGKEEFSDIVNIVNDMQECILINGSITNELNASIAKMMLTKFGHTDNPSHLKNELKIGTGTEVQQADSVIKCVERGEIEPSVAVTLIQSIKAKADIRKTSELEERIEQLEKLAG